MSQSLRQATILPTDQEKPRYVNAMFARIAPTYDVMNRLMTGGQDRRWRRDALAYCQVPVGGRLLDVGTGTGDLARGAEALGRGVAAVGVDFTYEMLAAGQRPQAGFVQGDTLHLPFADNTFDAVVSGFLVRNVVDRRGVLREHARVTKPGGRVVCLETTPPPRGNLLGPLFQFYFLRVIPWLGGLVSGDAEAYAYLPHSTLNFAAPVELAQHMEQVGLRDVFYVPRMFGAVAIHVGTKAGTKPDQG
ncbi:MAG: ubiquinone/menaquinone biosynthesis methyltransferase [Litorilinea sp.]